GASVVGRMAVRALVGTARDTRDGVLDAAAVARTGLGEILADVSASADTGADPWLTEAVIEAERIFRRLGHWARVFPADARSCAERQAMRLWATSERRIAWLAGAA